MISRFVCVLKSLYSIYIAYITSAISAVIIKCHYNWLVKPKSNSLKNIGFKRNTFLRTLSPILLIQLNAAFWLHKHPDYAVYRQLILFIIPHVNVVYSNPRDPERSFVPKCFRGLVLPSWGKTLFVCFFLSMFSGSIIWSH